MIRVNLEEDRRILEQRKAFVAHLEPHVDGIMQDDKYTYGAINALPPKIGAEVLMAIADFAAVQRFGRTSREFTRMVNDRRTGLSREKDPLLEGYERRFKKVGIDDAADFVQITIKASDTVLTAYHRDFTLWQE